MTINHFLNQGNVNSFIIVILVVNIVKKLVICNFKYFEYSHAELLRHTQEDDNYVFFF